jgi:hypothetical protein
MALVTFQGAARACELGDLLLVHDHLPDQARFERRATVIQAKVFGPHGVTSRNDIQWRFTDVGLSLLTQIGRAASAH